MARACRRRPATGEMKGTFAAKALATFKFRAAREASIALIAVSPVPTIGCDDAGLRWTAS